MKTEMEPSKTLLDWGTPKEWGIVALTAFLAGLIARIPLLFDIDPEYFYPRNIGSIVFPALLLYLFWKRPLPLRQFLVAFSLMITSIIFLNLLPGNEDSPVFVLSALHIPVLFWFLFGYVYLGTEWRNPSQRVAFLRYNGDLLVMGGLIVLAGILFTALTIGVFDLIGFQIEQFYFDYIALWGLSAIPVVTAFLLFNNTALVSKIAPLIAKIFAPLAFLMLLIFSVAIHFSDKNLFIDRALLLAFNIILIAVLALILFSLTDHNSGGKSKFQLLILFLLAGLCLLDNLFALSALGSRLFTYGFSANRTALLGLNLLMLTHLLSIAKQLFSAVRGRGDLILIEKSIGFFLPIYAIWVALVAFLFPLFF